LYLQCIGDVKVKLHREVEGKIKTVRFKREADGWHVVFSCELPDVEIESSSLPAVGIDLGLKSFLVTSQGEEIAPPKFYRKAQAKLRKAQRKVARRKKGGHRRRKAVHQLQGQHQHIANQRRDFHHKTARSLVEKHGAIAHEKLNVKGIAKTRLAKSTHDVGWTQFLAILKHKAECAGLKTIAVNPRYTTQTCSACGSLPPVPLTLRDRVYHCTSCHHVCDRDLNAAVNILKAARTEPSGANVSVVMLSVA
jgi:putative transposase